MKGDPEAIGWGLKTFLWAKKPQLGVLHFVLRKFWFYLLLARLVLVACLLRSAQPHSTDGGGGGTAAHPASLEMVQNRTTALFRARWSESRLRGHFPPMQSPSVGGFNPSEWPQRTRRIPYRAALGNNSAWPLPNHSLGLRRDPKTPSRQFGGPACTHACWRGGGSAGKLIKLLHTSSQ